MIKKAKIIIKASGDEQEPEIVYSSGNLQVPFALSIKEETKIEHKSNFSNNAPRRLRRERNPNSGLIAAGIAIVAILLIANSSD